MAATRMQKLNRMLREELARIFVEEMNDPRLGLTSITEVDTAPDLSSATIYISVYGEEEVQQTTLLVLKGASSFLRGELSRAVELRHTPQLRFRLDPSLARGTHVLDLIQHHLPAPAPEETPAETPEEKPDAPA
jgi:ribosome-binding factor A